MGCPPTRSSAMLITTVPAALDRGATSSRARAEPGAPRRPRHRAVLRGDGCARRAHDRAAASILSPGLRSSGRRHRDAGPARSRVRIRTASSESAHFCIRRSSPSCRSRRPARRRAADDLLDHFLDSVPVDGPMGFKPRRRPRIRCRWRPPAGAGEGLGVDAERRISMSRLALFATPHPTAPAAP